MDFFFFKCSILLQIRTNGQCWSKDFFFFAMLWAAEARFRHNTDI